MSKLKKIMLFLFVLPLTVFLDFIIFSLSRNCASCGSFQAWLTSEAALSFPLIVTLGDWFNRLLIDLKLISNPGIKVKHLGGGRLERSGSHESSQVNQI
ncbi:hypothetical protein A3J20_05720 [Candidatus Gottesmanbacteria bacterium RIFCSPLOWO2_02_FULL_42_29]|uniref:Uncharacterized protein n=1 Tax=Candidatus Gottesmanbacteria bacterium RIFCSPLOWO2_01_FULL_42_22 TaxID=1798391 RepID=A0A1F6BJP0_9BACT|nr:MAG: hypothetical protein A2781_01155 [Candidatus Gottesmanbacteria bacterium RIFCSPHIGHO2_01_FULL_42_27]OGG22242.1 MAG: hypothetical protein A3E72_02970 [Candidatus Gottesmanbacteria bacterium RIFCSPHIGHO2_12_FULL_43_26]OGG33216.1 MAG: hypothetical protein A3G68_07240 [Candidatus Gottesmanbacteria bacterium RIFCSPLOWO2_12_FULL_42_10]OGG37063.1 MAG: hypothetical protein A2968_01285 [Candidatus Gottesmanbacteria bacterium RIFCSPLOWO2_01_FULL_42_22]OGG38924.1 MAG: hypothetical protein A3J20_05